VRPWKETCRNFIMMDADARDRGYPNDVYNTEICQIINGATFPNELGNIIFTHSNGGPSVAKTITRAYCARGDRPVNFSNPPLFGSQAGNFAGWACSHAQDILGQALSDIFSFITNWFVETLAIILLAPVLFVAAMVWNFTCIGDMIIQTLQGGAYCQPNSQYITVFDFQFGTYINLNIGWTHYSPSHQTVVFEYLNVSNSPVGRYAVYINETAFDGTCAPASGDPTGCDPGNFLVGTLGNSYVDFNRHDDDDPGAHGWGLFNDDDDHNSGYTYKWMNDDAVAPSFWTSSSPASTYNGRTWKSGDNSGDPNQYWKYDSNARLCGYSAMGASVGMGLAMFGIGLLARMRVHWDHWCINWGPYDQFCHHRGCHNFMGLDCIDWIGAMDSNDGMVDMISCTFGRHKSGGQPCQHPNGFGMINDPHPNSGSRPLTTQPANHEDGTGRNGYSWLNDPKKNSGAKDPKSWIWAHAHYWAKEAKVKWCDDQGHSHYVNGVWKMKWQCWALNSNISWMV